ncbi:hypothetical protein GGX14DRAFT_569834 [Mycena pura]|uniref:Uncharacterized protein n=1 Tax=Mycena pura TaxID=153505 RepID=A0AAD6V5Y0_9AGAR|nr:hypothetical protein GGX14DRAFT_569834 [Mycena pura]
MLPPAASHHLLRRRTGRSTAPDIYATRDARRAEPHLRRRCPSQPTSCESDTKAAALSSESFRSSRSLSREHPRDFLRKGSQLATRRTLFHVPCEVPVPAQAPGEGASMCWATARRPWSPSSSAAAAWATCPARAPASWVDNKPTPVTGTATCAVRIRVRAQDSRHRGAAAAAVVRVPVPLVDDLDNGTLRSPSPTRCRAATLRGTGASSAARAAGRSRTQVSARSPGVVAHELERDGPVRRGAPSGSENAAEKDTEHQQAVGRGVDGLDCRDALSQRGHEETRTHSVAIGSATSVSLFIQSEPEVRHRLECALLQHLRRCTAPTCELEGV